MGMSELKSEGQSFTLDSPGKSRYKGGEMLRIKSKIWIEADGELILSDGRMALLRAIDELGSISKAARRMRMSYRAAWGKLKTTEKRMGVRLLEVKVGGRNGGGATLTRQARVLMQRYQAVKEAVNREADLVFAKAFLRR